MKMQTKHSRIVKKVVANYAVAYRIEHSVQHIGPYQYAGEYGISEFWDYFCTKMQRADKKHPTPEQEGINISFALGCIYGCASLHAIKEWFGEFYKPLLENEGFQLVKYVVRRDGIIKTKTQVLIEPEKVIKKVVVKQIHN